MILKRRYLPKLRLLHFTFAFFTALFVLDARAAEEINSTAAKQIATIERRVGGRLGVFALDTSRGKEIKYRATEPFPICSTFKFLLAAAILERVDKNNEKLDRRISYSENDLLGYAPVTKEHVKDGMTISELCEAAIELSDNTAANLLLQTIGGPSKLTEYVRSLGDSITRLDRTEPTLNTAIPGDDRDTTSAVAMANDMKTLLLGKALSESSRQRLQDWLIANKTGAKRLRSGMPSTWRIGDKTGTGENGATNDIAIVWPLNRAPFLVTVYFMGSNAPSSEREAVIAEVGRLVADSLW
jgi:beta-lactamase class A